MAEESFQVRVYLPDRMRRMGWRAYGEMAAEFWGARELLRGLIWRDLLLRVRVSFLGIFWSVAHPLALLGVFLFLKETRVFNLGTEQVHYALFAYVGVLHWNLFAALLSNSAGSLSGASNLVAKVRFPREVLVFSACTRALVDYLFALPVLGALCVWYGVTPAWTACWLPLALVPLVILGTGLGMVLALTALPIRDVAYALPLLMTPLMFLSPVLYELPETPAWSWVRVLNPLAAFLDTLRALLFSGTWGEAQGFLLWSLGSVVIFLGCWRFFSLVVVKVPEYA